MEYAIIGGIIALFFLFSGKSTPVVSTPTSTIAPDTLGFKLNNPGLLQVLKSGELWLGQIGVYTHPQSGHKFAIFKDLAHGLRALCVNALDKFIDAQWVLDLRTFGEFWAPASDNAGTEPGDYGEDLAKVLGVNAGDTYPAQDQTALARLAWAIVINENNKVVGDYQDSIPTSMYLTAAQTALNHWGV